MEGSTGSRDGEGNTTLLSTTAAVEFNAERCQH